MVQNGHVWRSWSTETRWTKRAKRTNGAFCQKLGQKQQQACIGHGLKASSDSIRLLADILPYTIFTTRITNIIIFLPNFDKSLKITWLRKLLNDEPDWIEFANHYKINRLTTTDINYHKKILRQIDNPFWKSVAKAYSEWFSHCKAQYDTPIGRECLWGNPRVNIPF